MKHWIAPIVFLVCASTTQAEQKHPFKVIPIPELATLLSQKPVQVKVYDVNTESLRQGKGVIPGSQLVSYKDFDPKKELPPQKDAKLVFYCANEYCTASHSTAKKALDNGYTDVSVLTAGILGWIKAGQPVQKVN